MAPKMAMLRLALLLSLLATGAGVHTEEPTQVVLPNGWEAETEQVLKGAHIQQMALVLGAAEIGAER